MNEAGLERSGTFLLGLMRRIEEASFLDPIADSLLRGLQPLSTSKPLTGVLRGSWLGHSLHPLLTDFTEGPWMATTFLDLFGPPGSAPAARRLLGIGLLAAVPTYLTGVADWAAARRVEEKRVGLVHLLTSSLAVALYSASYVTRGRERRAKPVLLGLAAGVVALAEGYVAGHAGHVQGTGFGPTANAGRDPRHETG
ncbi:MAG: DUF2231 domain-containing protein [Actinomycetota bacterium]|nr:DUF2231 domain-containing protein [Actinomycetota bacterium]